VSESRPDNLFQEKSLKIYLTVISKIREKLRDFSELSSITFFQPLYNIVQGPAIYNFHI
jgi:hypothetical protein